MSANAVKERAGRLCRQIRKCLITNGGRPVTITDLLNYCYPGSRTHPKWRRKSIHRALPRYAVSVGRMDRGSGRPCLYGPNAELMRIIRAT